jgi:hypothetical protein
MFEKVSKIFLGVLVGLVLVATAWYLISGFTSSDVATERINKINDDLLSNPVIDTVNEKTSVINFPISVSQDEVGVNNPF